MTNPIDSFFKLGNKVSNGNPVKKAQFDYYLFWILFLAFVYLMINNFFIFYQSGFVAYSNLAWGFVMAVIVWFNYNGLVAFYNSYTNLKRVFSKQKENKQQEELKVESVEEMMGGFK